MKKLFFLPLFIGLFVTSCKINESCTLSAAPERVGRIQVDVLTVDQAGNSVSGYPAGVTFQKHWCDGDVDIEISYNGLTEAGIYTDYFPGSYYLYNEEDYISIDVYVGQGSDRQVLSDVITYLNFASSGSLIQRSYTFTVDP